MPTVYVYIGLPASVKSTHAHEWAAAHSNAIHLSSDEIREELYGDARIQGDPNKVFSIMLRRAREAIAEGLDVLYDATNITYKNRRSILQIPNATFVARLFVVSVEECKRRNSERARKVPDSVIGRMVRQFQPPCEWEGFDRIERFDCGETLTYQDLMRPMLHFSQQNPHHTLTLDSHCSKTYETLMREPETCTRVVALAGMLHDCGKPYTQTFDDSGIAHYYGHENYGAYLSLFLMDRTNRMYISQLIAWHMAPYKEVYWEKMKKVMSPNFVKDLEALHRADKEAY